MAKFTQALNDPSTRGITPIADSSSLTEAQAMGGLLGTAVKAGQEAVNTYQLGKLRGGLGVIEGEALSTLDRVNAQYHSEMNLAEDMVAEGAASPEYGNLRKELLRLKRAQVLSGKGIGYETRAAAAYRKAVASRPDLKQAFDQVYGEVVGGVAGQQMADRGQQNAGFLSEYEVQVEEMNAQREAAQKLGLSGDVFSSPEGMSQFIQMQALSNKIAQSQQYVEAIEAGLIKPENVPVSTKYSAMQSAVDLAEANSANTIVGIMSQVPTLQRMLSSANIDPSEAGLPSNKNKVIGMLGSPAFFQSVQQLSPEERQIMMEQTDAYKLQIERQFQYSAGVLDIPKEVLDANLARATAEIDIVRAALDGKQYAEVQNTLIQSYDAKLQSKMQRHPSYNIGLIAKTTGVQPTNAHTAQFYKGMTDALSADDEVTGVQGVTGLLRGVVNDEQGNPKRVAVPAEITEDQQHVILGEIIKQIENSPGYNGADVMAGILKRSLSNNPPEASYIVNALSSDKFQETYGTLTEDQKLVVRDAADELLTRATRPAVNALNNFVRDNPDVEVSLKVAEDGSTQLELNSNVVRTNGARKEMRQEWDKYYSNLVSKAVKAMTRMSNDKSFATRRLEALIPPNIVIDSPFATPIGAPAPEPARATSTAAPNNLSDVTRDMAAQRPTPVAQVDWQSLVEGMSGSERSDLLAQLGYSPSEGVSAKDKERERRTGNPDRG